MRGSHTLHSIPKFLAALAVAATLVLGLWPTPAEAHLRRAPMLHRKYVASRARSQLGADYRWGGASPRGFDCSGFALWVFRRHGVALPHNSLMQFKTARRPRFKRVWKRGKLDKGDLVFFKTTGARVGHVGIYVGHGTFIHASSGSDRVRRDSIWDRGYYGRRFVGGVRTPTTMR